jgi:16S rRNA (cytosine967-C5)-methyltransferase
MAADVREFPMSVRFDRVLVDVPCSGTGTLAHNPEIKWRLTLADIADLQGRQTAILESAMKHVASGGRLVYSTCSLEREENEEVVEKALATDQSLQLLECHQELERLHDEKELTWTDLESLTQGPYLRTLPGVHPCDGFFAAILEKT